MSRNNKYQAVNGNIRTARFLIYDGKLLSCWDRGRVKNPSPDLLSGLQFSYHESHEDPYISGSVLTKLKVSGEFPDALKQEELDGKVFIIDSITDVFSSDDEVKEVVEKLGFHFRKIEFKTGDVSHYTFYEIHSSDRKEKFVFQNKAHILSFLIENSKIEEIAALKGIEQAVLDLEVISNTKNEQKTDILEDLFVNWDKVQGLASEAVGDRTVVMSFDPVSMED